MTNNNRMLIDRIKGVAGKMATPETDADPRNPNVYSSELAELRELHRHVKKYYTSYMLDEAEDREICVDDRQHELAGAIRDCLNRLRPR